MDLAQLSIHAPLMFFIMVSINANTENTKTQSFICIMLFLRDMHALVKFNKIIHIVCVILFSFPKVRLRTTNLTNKKFLFQEERRQNRYKILVSFLEDQQGLPN